MVLETLKSRPLIFRRWHSKLHTTSDAKDLILSVLRSTATKREAKQYISKYTPWTGRDIQAIHERREFVQSLLKQPPQLKLFRSGEDHVTNSYSQTFEHTQLGGNMLRVAIIKMRDLKSVDTKTFLDLGKTIVRLVKLGVSPVVVVDAGKQRNDFLGLDNKPFRLYERDITWKAAALASAIETATSDGSVRARPVEGLFDLDSSSNEGLKFSVPNLIMLPLSNGVVPVVVPLAYDHKTGIEKLILADDAVVYLSNEMSKHEFISVEKIIFVDPLGGIPSIERKNGSHVYVNLVQELQEIVAELHLPFISATEREIQLDNLKTLDRALRDGVTGLITTPKSAALSSSSQNPIIYNILTDRPIVSPSLPIELKKTPRIETTIVRKGMHVLKYQSKRGLGLDITKLEGVDLARLWALIEDSFGRKLDTEHYMNRINGKVAGLIIAGDYEGAAIITWEEEPAEHHERGVRILSELDRINIAAENSRHRKVAYLDKFAVKSSSQGSSQVADILFKTMAIELFPQELLWRSRKNNPVNKWYFERSKGSLKLPKSQFCAFWSGNGTREETNLKRYINICTSIEPSWVS